jgi:flagellar motor component MotA
MRFTSLLSYIISGLLVYLSFWIAEGSHFNPLMFWDLASFLVILGGLSISLVNFKFSEIINALKDSISGQPANDFRSRYELDKVVLKSMGNYVIFAAVIFFVLTFIMVMGTLESTAKLGPNLAVALLVIMYAVILKVVMFIPFSVALDKKMLQIQVKSEG